MLVVDPQIKEWPRDVGVSRRGANDSEDSWIGTRSYCRDGRVIVVVGQGWNLGLTYNFTSFGLVTYTVSGNSTLWQCSETRKTSMLAVRSRHAKWNKHEDGSVAREIADEVLAVPHDFNLCMVRIRAWQVIYGCFDQNNISRHCFGVPCTRGEDRNSFSGICGAFLRRGWLSASFLRHWNHDLKAFSTSTLCIRHRFTSIWYVFAWAMT